MKYLTNCKYLEDRNADYAKAKTVIEKWEFSKKELGGCGNLCSEILFDPKTKEARFETKKDKDAPLGKSLKQISIYKAIPSALLMYRLACTFKGTFTSEGQEGYKVTWQFTIKHKATGKFLTFGEWKGGSLFWTDWFEPEDPIRKDLLEILTYLVSDTCAHPYDGLVAGSVA